MSPNHRSALERFQRAQRMFAFQGTEPARDDALPITATVLPAMLDRMHAPKAPRSFPVLAGAFTPFELEVA